jgi:hypothetical protein
MQGSRLQGAVAHFQVSSKIFDKGLGKQKWTFYNLALSSNDPLESNEAASRL